MRDVLVGALGALVGGVLYREMGFHNLQNLNPGSIIVSVGGSIALLVIYRMLGAREGSNA